MLSDFMGISLHSYYLAHHWIGRVVILQSLIHVGLVIRAKRLGPLTLFKSRA